MMLLSQNTIICCFSLSLLSTDSRVLSDWFSCSCPASGSWPFGTVLSRLAKLLLSNINLTINSFCAGSVNYCSCMFCQLCGGDV